VVDTVTGLTTITAVTAHSCTLHDATYA